MMTTHHPPKQNNIKVLVIDDNQGHLDAIFNEVSSMGYETITAEHGREGCKIMSRQGNSIGAIVLDREMPVMDGMEFIHWLKNNGFAWMPVIMATSDQNPETITKSIDAGVFYYLTKPLDQEILGSILNAALTESKRRMHLHKEIQNHSHSIRLIHKCMFCVKTLADAESVARFAANFFPKPDIVLQGIAELIINAVEHGNLGVGYDAKTTLIASKIWRDEINKRQQLPENMNKEVMVYFENTDDSYQLLIKDQGNGFDWKKYLDINPSRALDNHGRGIAQAKLTSFDDIIYNSKGNEVRAVCYKNADNKTIDWH